MIYLILTLLSLILLIICYKISKFFNFYDYPSKIKIHSTKIPNIAGIALIPYLIVVSFFLKIDDPIKNTLYVTLVVVICGFIDDIKNIKPKIKLIILFFPFYIFITQISMVHNLGNYNFGTIYLGQYSFIFSIMCIFLLTNAYNYIDGLDGLLSINLIITLFFLNFLSSNFNLILIAIIIFLSIYLLFNFNTLNFFPKQFIGDSGSLGLGFLVSSILILFTQKIYNIHPAIIIWSVAFVVYEFLTINIIRIKEKKNIFSRDLNFIFNILKNKYSSIISLIICTLLHIKFCIISIILDHYNLYFISISLFVLSFFIYLFFRLKQNKN